MLTEIGNIGAGHAATVLSKLTKQPIQISVPKLETGPLHLIARLIGAPDSQVTAVHMALATEPGCDTLIVFDSEEVKKIASLMTSESTPVSQDIAMSAVQEMGSIMLCAFYSSIANFAELTIVPSRPNVFSDYFEAIIDVFWLTTDSGEICLDFQNAIQQKRKFCKRVLAYDSNSRVPQTVNGCRKKMGRNC